MSKFCFFIPLKIGCFIIAYFHLVMIALPGTLYTVITIMPDIGLSYPPEKFEEKAPSYINVAGVILLIIQSLFNNIYLIPLILSTSFAITLLVGLHQNKPKLLKAYWMCLGIYIIVFLLTLFTVRSESLLAEITSSVPIIAIYAYALLVIRSYHIEMVEEQGRSNTKDVQEKI